MAFQVNRPTEPQKKNKPNIISLFFSKVSKIKYVVNVYRKRDMYKKV